MSQDFHEPNFGNGKCGRKHCRVCHIPKTGANANNGDGKPSPVVKNHNKDVMVHEGKKDGDFNDFAIGNCQNGRNYRL